MAGGADDVFNSGVLAAVLCIMCYGCICVWRAAEMTEEMPTVRRPIRGRRPLSGCRGFVQKVGDVMGPRSDYQSITRPIENSQEMQREVLRRAEGMDMSASQSGDAEDGFQILVDP